MSNYFNKTISMPSDAVVQNPELGTVGLEVREKLKRIVGAL